MAKALRKCRKCNIEANCIADLEMFRTNNKLKYSKDNICKECHSTQCREQHLQSTYNITSLEYERMLEAQEYVCYICKASDPNNKTKYMCVDHNHTTGRIRGLLCHDCNTGLGKFKDSPLLLIEAYKYLIEKGGN